MSAVFDERDAFLQNPFLKREYGDFTAFYVIIAICTIFGAFLFLLNFTLCCSRYREYWLDTNTGNRWVLPIWIKTPYKQPPLDLTELNEEYILPPPEPYYETQDYYSDFEVPIGLQEEYLELQHHQQYQPQQVKKESDL